MDVQMGICTKNILCVDCDDTKCWHSGKIYADCPKYRCDRPEDFINECESCDFIKEYQRDMRKYYKEKGSVTNDVERNH